VKFCPHCSAFYPDESAFCPDDGAPLKAMQDPHLGRTIAGRYRLVKLLGTGGMSYVYLAHHVVIERLSALKILREDLAKNPAQQASFLREARAVNRINHPNIVEISDMGEADGVTYQVMEYVDGPSLFHELGKGIFGWERAIRVGLQVAAALGRAHQMGVIHRDLKPENILLARRPQDAVGHAAMPRQLVHATIDLVKLTDFGVAKILDEPSAAPVDRLAGTPGYIAPECLRGQAADPRADLYALGVVLYEMTTGALPFDDVGDALLKAPLHHAPVPPQARRADYPDALGALVMSLLAPEPAGRPATAFAVYEALVGLLRTEAGETRGAVAGYVARAATEPHNGPSTLRDPPSPAAPPVSTPTPAKELTAAAAVTAFRWHEALAELDASIATVQKNRATAETVERALELATVARAKVRALERASRLAITQQEWVDTLDAEGREFRAEIGRALDQLVLERSRERAEADAASARLEELDAAPDDQSDVRLWETAALEVVTGSFDSLEEDLTFQIDALERRLTDRNLALEQQQVEANGALEGSLLAIRHLTHEFTDLLHEARSLVGESGERDLVRPALPPVVSVADRSRAWRR
jgi:serine/threonine-protein kinase